MIGQWKTLKQLFLGVFFMCFVFSCSSRKDIPSNLNPAKSCLIDEDCPTNYLCQNERCRLHCNSNTDCPESIPICNTDGFCTTTIGGDVDIDTMEEDYLENLDKDDFDEYVEKNEKDSLECTDLDDVFNEDDEEIEDYPFEHEDICELELEEEVEIDEEEPCVCEEGTCFDGCYLSLSGVLCEEAVETNYRCDPTSVSLCDADVQMQIINRVCSGYSKACDGPLVPGEWQRHSSCTTSEICTPNGCELASEQCCECEEGACCSYCRYLSENNICDIISYELGCPFGTYPGSDVWERSNLRYCSGTSPNCDGSELETQWELLTDCPEWLHCELGECVPNTCEVDFDCEPFDHYYCRLGECVYYEEHCGNYPVQDCEPAGTFCNTSHYACLPLSGPCFEDDDCTNHPSGDTCDSRISKCVGPVHCDVDQNNCYPGTECRELNELFGYEGKYCVECENDTDCYPGLHCDNRLLYTNVCSP